jgi:hypothetical protein
LPGRGGARTSGDQRRAPPARKQWPHQPWSLRAACWSADAAIDGGNGGRAFANIGPTPQGLDSGLRRGNSKTPSLRNVDLTGPDFHTGRYLTLRQVVDFYDRGGEVDNRDKDSQVRRLGLREGEKRDLVAFMLALTDERVRYLRAPFDHPSLNLPDGVPLPAVGAGGRQQPVRRFLDADPFQR